MAKVKRRRAARNLRKRNGIWWYRFIKDGKELQGSLDTRALAVAQERLAVARRRIEDAQWGKRPRRTFEEVCEVVAEQHFPNLKPRSAEQYRVSMANLAPDFRGVRLDEIGSARLAAFELRRRRMGVTGSTIRRDLACLSMMFTKAEEWEWVDRNPVKPFLRGRQLAGLEENQPRTRWLTLAEEREILAAASEALLPAIIFAIDTGLRKEEQLSLLRSDVDMAHRQVTVRAAVAKNGKGRIVPLLKRTVELIGNLQPRTASQYLFHTPTGERYSPNSNAFYSGLQAAVGRANRARGAGQPAIAHVSWHDLRRTCGCRLLQDHRLPMDYVSRWLGHSSVRVTEKHYAFLSHWQLHEAVRQSEGTS